MDPIQGDFNIDPLPLHSPTEVPYRSIPPSIYSAAEQAASLACIKLTSRVFKSKPNFMSGSGEGCAVRSCCLLAC